MNPKGAVLVLVTVVFTVIGQVLMKKGIPQSDTLGLKTIFSSPVLVAGAFCYAAGFFSWINALNLLPLSIAMPASSISFVLAVFASALFLNEPVTPGKIAGVVMIVSGVFVISNFG